MFFSAVRKHQRATSSRQFLLSVLFASVFFSASFIYGEHLPVKTYTVIDGLPQNQINKIKRDQTGFFWFCTDGGLARFDGYNFTNFTIGEGLPSDKIRDFLVSNTGEYWLATTGGLVKFTPDGTVYNRPVMIDEVSALTETPVFITYPLPNAKNKTITALLEDRSGAIWIGANEGLFKLENHDGRLNLSNAGFDLSAEDGSRHIYFLYEDRSGAIWFGTENALFRRSAGGILTSYAQKESPPVYFRTMIEDRSGNFLVGTLKKGLFQFSVDEPDSSLRLQRKLTPDADSEINWIESIIESSDGKLWLGTSGGLYEFDAASGKIYRYTRQSGIGNNRFQTMFEDKNGDLWLGTRANGVFRLSTHGLISYGLEDEIAFVWSVSATLDDSLFLTGFLANQELVQKGAKAEVSAHGKVLDHYLWRLGRLGEDGLKWLRPALPASIDYFGSGENQTSFQSRGGEWWIATGEGLFRYPKTDFENLPATQPITVLNKESGLKPQDVFRLYEDSRGDIWISTGDESGRELYRWERGSEKLFDAGRIEGFPAENRDLVSSFAEDHSGNLWIGFLNRGFARISGGKARYFDLPDGVPQGGANDIFVDREGRIWIASGREGVARIDSAAAEHPQIIKIGKNEGLSTNRTFAVTQDLQGLIYIATDRDINCLNPATGKIKVLKVSGNQPPREFRSAFCDRKGTLWFGTTAGLVKYTPLPDSPGKTPEVLLTRIEVDGKLQKVPFTGAASMDLDAFSPDENQVRIDFISLAALDGEDVRYQYKLDTQSDWSEPSAERSINFAKLAPGDYEILIRALTFDDIPSRQPAVVLLKILPPFYLRWWFVAGFLTIIIFSVYAAYRYRLAQLLQLERVRTRIATDLHDDIGSNLTKISILSEVVKQQNTGGRNNNLLNSIADISRESVSALSDIVWAINPNKDSLLGLTRRMRRHAEETCEQSGIDLKFLAPEIVSDIKLDADTRRNVYLIYKESLNNIIRHSQATAIEISFEFTDRRLFLTIGDDGAGFDTAQNFDGNGLTNMKKRAEELNGKVEIFSMPVDGTKISLQIPFEQKKRK